MVNSRQKGKVGERELAQLLRDNLGDIYPDIQRNINQSRDGGKDLTGTDPWAVEVKRGERPEFNKWLAQATDQAGPGEVPVVAWRPNGKGWLFLFAITPPEFFRLARALYAQRHPCKCHGCQLREHAQSLGYTVGKQSEGTNAAE